MARIFERGTPLTFAIHSVSNNQKLWHQPEFLRLWSAQAVSVLGSQFTALAVPLLAAGTLHASPREMSILSASASVPFLVFGLIVGVWVDQYPRRRILVFADVGRAMLLLMIPLAAFTGALSMVHLYVVMFLSGILAVFYDVASQSYLPLIVGRAWLVQANSKLEAARSTAQIVGPGVAGLVIQLISAPVAILLDAFSFLCSSSLVGFIRKSEEKPRISHPSWVAEMRTGIDRVFRNDFLRPIAACTATANLFGAAIAAVYILFITRELKLLPVAIGVVFAIGNIGALAGSLLATLLAERLGLGRVIAGGALVFGLGCVLIFVASFSGIFALPLLITSRFLVSSAIPIYSINQVSLRQVVTPKHFLGRVNATMRFVVWGTLPIGALLGGGLGEVFGLANAIAIAAFGALAAFLWIVRSPVFALRGIPDRPPEAFGTNPIG